MHLRLGRIWLLLFVAAGCRGDAPAPAGSANFELVCDSSDTALASQLFCVRTDTRTGDIKVVTYRALPTSNGSTRSAGGSPGRYTTVCDATSTDRSSDFYCIRLDTVTGDMMLVNLQKLAAVPGLKPPIPRLDTTR